MTMIQNNAWACSCIGPKGTDILLGNAAVFSGKALEVMYLEPDGKYLEPPIRVTFEVSEVWEGPVRNTISVSTIYNKFSCEGYYFKQGQHYLVAAKSITLDNSKASIAEVEGLPLCGGTSTLENASENIKAFGEGQRPKKTNLSNKNNISVLQ